MAAAVDSSTRAGQVVEEEAASDETLFSMQECSQNRGCDCRFIGQVWVVLEIGAYQLADFPVIAASG